MRSKNYRAHLHNRIYPRQIVLSSNSNNSDCVSRLFSDFFTRIWTRVSSSSLFQICSQEKYVCDGSFVGERIKKKKKIMRLKIIRTGIKFVKHTRLRSSKYSCPFIFDITKAVFKSLISIKYHHRETTNRLCFEKKNLGEFVNSRNDGGRRF